MTSHAIELARKLIDLARDKGLSIATAESCTGGLLAGALTDIAGSSDVFERGFVTYSNMAKAELLGIDPELIAAKGAVSREVALAMAIGVLRAAPVDLSAAITGIAGPGGGTAEKPVGLVHFAVAKIGEPSEEVVHREERFGAIGRAAIREKSVEIALAMLLEMVKE